MRSVCVFRLKLIGAMMARNEKVYDHISLSVPKEMAAAFKAKCAAEGIPQAQVLKRAIEAFLAE